MEDALNTVAALIGLAVALGLVGLGVVTMLKPPKGRATNRIEDWTPPTGDWPEVEDGR